MLNPKVEVCKHGLKPGKCECFEERTIKSLEDAIEVFESGKATWQEWGTCANYFIKAMDQERAIDCIVRATTMLRDPRTQTKEFVGLVGQYLEARASQVIDRPSESQYWLLKLADQIKRDLRVKLNFRKQAFEELLDPEIAQMLLLAASRDKYSKMRLAAKLRRQRAFETQIRWGRPQVAKEILDEVLSANPRDTYALVCRSATHRDLGNLTDSIEDAKTALSIEPNNNAAKIALASTYLAGLQPHDAVKLIVEICESTKPNVALVCMIYIACGLMEQSAANTARSLADRLMLEIDPDWNPDKTRHVIEIAAIKMLCANQSFLQAFQLLAELDREDWTGNTNYWRTEIERLAKQKPGYPTLPSLEALKANPQDFYPDHNGGNAR